VNLVAPFPLALALDRRHCIGDNEEPWFWEDQTLSISLFIHKPLSYFTFELCTFELCSVK